MKKERVLLTGNRSHTIQMLRGLACLAVFFSHAIGALPTGYWQIGSVDLNTTPLRLLWGGNAAVVVFFVLSGFFFYKTDYRLTVRGWMHTVFNRHVRIYCVYIPILLLGVAARFTYPPFSGLSEWMSGFWTDEFSLKQLAMHFALISRLIRI